MRSLGEDLSAAQLQALLADAGADNHSSGGISFPQLIKLLAGRMAARKGGTSSSGDSKPADVGQAAAGVSELAVGGGAGSPVERLGLHDPWLSQRSLRQGMFSLGDMARMRRFTQKLLSGEWLCWWLRHEQLVATTIAARQH